MNKLTDLYNAGCMVDEAVSALTQAMSAFNLTLDNMENEGIQTEDNPVSDIVFVARLPLYVDTFHLISQKMQSAIEHLKIESDSIFETVRNQRDKTVE